MNQGKSCRVREETIEKFVTDRLAGRSLARFEEHLLICERCQQRTVEGDLYVAAIRRALSATMEAAADERRGEPRQFVERAVTISMPNGKQTVVGRTTDISRSGVGLTLRVKVAQGVPVLLATGGHRYKGEIAWCAAQGASYRVGVRLSA